MSMLRLVGGADYSPNDPVVKRATVPSVTATGRNYRLRLDRREVWRASEAATEYWRAAWKFRGAISSAQGHDIPEGRLHPRLDWVGPGGIHEALDIYREAIARQLLTPAPDGAAVAWKRAALKTNRCKHLGITEARAQQAIADDIEFLATHPVRQSISEEERARRREFKDAMRQRIRDVAASRNLSDEEIRPALTLKHQKIAQFSEQHGVNLQWLFEGVGPIFKTGGRCELMDILDGA